MNKVVESTRAQLYSGVLPFKTDSLGLYDITDHIVELLLEEEIAGFGSMLVFSLHTTGAIIINESEDGFARDITALAERLAPSNGVYAHDDFSTRTQNLQRDEAGNITERINGRSHLLHLLLGRTSETIPIVDGRLKLGRWQRVFFLELDVADEPIEREVVIQTQTMS